MECNYLLDNGPSYDRCPQPATEIILWGCLQQHIMEFTVCRQHMNQWITEYHTGEIQCAHCMGYAASYLTNQICALKPDFQLRNIQYAMLLLPPMHPSCKPHHGLRLPRPTHLG